jgi:SOS response regulatory protein OraA/RecX
MGKYGPYIAIGLAVLIVAVLALAIGGGGEGEQQADDGATLGEKNALAKAQSYLRYSAFSQKGLYDQLKYEGFEDSEAEYGVQHCGADWYDQAEKKGQAYLRSQSFSKEGLYKQLVYEGFTTDQARKAVDSIYA